MKKLDQVRLKKSILIVDNDPDYVETMATVLQEQYKVYTAFTGHEAILQFGRHEVDLVLLDLELPKLDGIEVCRILKNLSRDKFIPIILISGYSDSNSIVKGYKYGADDYLTKPFNNQEILARCRAMLKIKELQDRLVDSENKLLKSHRELEKIVEDQILEIESINRLKRYFSPSIIKKIVDSQEAGQFGEIPVRKVVTTFFTDIRNFTQFSDQLAPEDTKVILDHYIQFITEIVFEFKGTVNKFLGDGILMVFGDPINEEDHPLCAIQTALAIKERLPEFQEIVRQITKIEMQIGMGIHSGPVVIGNVGADELMDYTIIGSAVNLAARLQGFSTQGEIIVTQSTIEPYKNYLKTQNERIVPIKGYQHPIAIAEVVSFIDQQKKSA